MLVEELCLAFRHYSTTFVAHVVVHGIFVAVCC